MREAPTAVPGSKPKSAAASWVRPSPRGLPGEHVALPAWHKTDALFDLLRGRFLEACLEIMFTYFGKVVLQQILQSNAGQETGIPSFWRAVGPFTNQST